MNGQNYNSRSGDISIEDGELTRPGRQAALPRVLDPIVTMGVVQKYLETERKRSRRVLFWLSAVFLFSVVFILVIFIWVGMFLYQNSRKAVGIADTISAQTAYYASEVIGISNKLTSLEERNAQIKDLVRTAEDNRSEESRLLKGDLQRFSQWVESLNTKDLKVLSELEAKMREMQQLISAKDNEIKELKKYYATLIASGGSPLRVSQGILDDPVEKPAAPGRDELPENVSGVATQGLFDEVMAIKEGSFTNKFEPRGEISVVTFPGGDRYEGSFKGGLLDGKGTYYYRNGDRYEGDFKGDMKNGTGIYYYANGDRYSGEFKNDMKQGKGSYVSHNGEKYVGEFKNDAITGKGTMIYPNGNKYAGDMKNGLKNGNGILCFGNGDVYKGEFLEDVRSGRGAYFFSDASKYIGDFKDDKRHGQGRYIFPGGEEYAGTFKDGKKDGEGVCVYPNGKRMKGLWRNDKFVEEIRE